MVKAKSKFEEPILTTAIQQFTMHNVFEVQVCNPASCYEKRSAENKVGYVKDNFFSDMSKMVNFSSLNIDLVEKMFKNVKKYIMKKIKQ